MKKLLLTLLIGFVLTGCSPYALVNSETYNNADLASYTTFRIVTPDNGKLPEGMEMVTYYNIAAAIREQMVERGFTEDPQSPLLINIGITTQKGVTTEPLENFYPYPYPYGVPPYAPYFFYPRQYYWPQYNPNAQVVTGIYKEGVLTMDFVNIAKKVPLYSASVATILNNGSPGGYRNLQGIDEAVKTLFSKFPVPLLPQYKK